MRPLVRLAGLWMATLALSLWFEVSAAQAPAADAQKLDTVKLQGQRNGGVDPSIVTAAKSKLLSRRFASSCAFMSGYSAAEDEATLAYLRNMRQLDSESNDAERFSDLSPGGNAKTDRVGSALEGSGGDTGSTVDPMAPATGCSATDKRFAAGRNWIARKDKSLAQGFDAYEAGDYAQARSRFEEGWHKLGYEEAALMLARMHLLGQGVPASTPQAVGWLRQVLDARYDPVADRLRFNPAQPDAVNTRVEAALLLARIHLTGVGTRRDAAAAYQAWAQALDFGFEPAGTLLAQAEISGVGTAPDGKRGLAHLQAAAEAGHVPALFMLGQLYQHRMPGLPGGAMAGVPLDLQRAGAYYGAAARAGHLQATYEAARMLDAGEGQPPAPQKAIVLYKEAALRGHADAQNALATYFYTGEVVEQNLATARQLFQAAAERRHPEAMFNLAVMLAQGQGGQKDLPAAYAWLSLCQALGLAKAEPALASVGARLSPEERARAEGLLKPKAPGS